MFKSWSFKNEYKNLNKKVLFRIDKVLKSDSLFFGKELTKLLPC